MEIFEPYIFRHSHSHINHSFPCPFQCECVFLFPLSGISNWNRIHAGNPIPTHTSILESTNPFISGRGWTETENRGNRHHHHHHHHHQQQQRSASDRQLYVRPLTTDKISPYRHLSGISTISTITTEGWCRRTD